MVDVGLTVGVMVKVNVGLNVGVEVGWATTTMFPTMGKLEKLAGWPPLLALVPDMMLIERV